MKSPQEVVKLKGEMAALFATNVLWFFWPLREIEGYFFPVSKRVLFCSKSSCLKPFDKWFGQCISLKPVLRNVVSRGKGRRSWKDVWFSRFYLLQVSCTTVHKEITVSECMISRVCVRMKLACTVVQGNVNLLKCTDSFGAIILQSNHLCLNHISKISYKALPKSWFQRSAFKFAFKATYRSVGVVCLFDSLFWFFSVSFSIHFSYLSILICWKCSFFFSCIFFLFY